MSTRVRNSPFSTGSATVTATPTQYYVEAVTLEEILAGSGDLQAGQTDAEGQDPIAGESSQLAEDSGFDEDILHATQYLSRLPPLPYTVQSQNENSSIHQGSGGGGSRPLFQNDDPIDLVVFDVYRRDRQPLQSIQSLRNHLHERRDNAHLRYVYLVPQESLSLGVVGLLGSFLGLDAEFWITHGGDVGLFWAQLRPTLLAQRRSISLAFIQTSDRNKPGPQVVRRTVSLGFNTRRTSAVILLPRYDLPDSTIRNLSLDTDYIPHPESANPPAPLTSLDAMVPRAIWYSSVTYQELLTFVARAIFPLAISEWTTTLEALEVQIRNSESAESDLRSDPSAEASRLRLLASTSELTFLLSHLASSWDSVRHVCGFTFSEPGDLSSRNDIEYLQQWSASLEKREQKLDDGEYRRNSSPPGQGGGGGGGGGGKAWAFGSGGSPSSPGCDPNAAKQKLNMDGIKLKVDQIAYVTTILLSLTFIATIYGMNVNNFSAEGIPSVVDYLAVALPFATGVLFLTFVPVRLLQRRSSQDQSPRLVTVSAV